MWSSGTQVDLLTESPEARQLLLQLLKGAAPLVPKSAAALLIAVTPPDGLTAAAERATSVLNAAPPLSAHVVRALLELVAAGARDAPSAALLLALLAPVLLGREAAEARDDGGLAAWLGTHLLVASSLHAARSGGRLLRHATHTHCVQLPVSCVRGGTLELAALGGLGQGQQQTGGTAHLGQSQVAAPDLTLAAQTVLSAQLQLAVQALGLEGTAGVLGDLVEVAVVTHAV